MRVQSRDLFYTIAIFLSGALLAHLANTAVVNAEKPWDHECYEVVAKCEQPRLIDAQCLFRRVVGLQCRRPSEP